MLLRKVTAMRMSRWGKNLIAVGITACVLAAFLFGYLRVNREYPPAERCVYTAGDTFTVNDLEIQNNGGELVTVPQLKERFPDAEMPSMIVNGQPLPEEKIRILLASVRVRTLSETATLSSLYTTGARSGAWRNGMDFDLYLQLNPSLEPDAEGYYNLVMPYEVNSLQFHDKDWKQIDSRTFELVFSMYPVENVMRLDA